MSKIVNAQELRDLIDSNQEMALIDVREAGIFTEAHLFFARSLPLSKIELNVENFLPRKSVTIIVMDAGDDNLSTRAERVLKKLGYVDVAIFSGGLKAWENAGFEIFTGANVPSKAFGEFIETSYHTPRMPAQEIKAKIEARENMIILDSRPFDEYHRMNIPGSINVPGAELVYRINDLIPDPDTLVVVNCAGRTRSIIGTQSLVNAGFKNEVVALKDGTMGWHLAGFKLEHGQNRVAPAPSEKGLEAAKKIVEEVAIRFDIQTINQEQLENYRQQSEERSLYLLDVRTLEEFNNGHLQGSQHAPGGQLIQGTDEYIGVLRSRIVLIDNDGVRATMTASWLKQLGWSDVSVYSDVLSGPLTRNEDYQSNRGEDIAIDFISAKEVKSLMRSSEAVGILDLSTSTIYKEGHIPGAMWTTRTRLQERPEEISNMDILVTVADDNRMAELAANDLLEFTPRSAIRILNGGNKAWSDAGFALETDTQIELTVSNDVSYKPYQKLNAVEEEMKNYLKWEIELLEQIEREGDVGFRLFD